MEREDRVEDDAASSGMQAVDRIVALLDAFTPDRPVAGVSDLARLTGMSRSTVHRLLGALAVHGMVQQLPGETTYSLGPRLLALSETARGHLTLQRQALPLMTWLRDRTDETVGLHVLDGALHRRVVAQVESRQPLRRTYTELGTPLPSHLGAPGRALLAFAPEAVREEVYRSRPLAADGRTPVDVAGLRRDLARVAADGYAISIQERVVGVVSLAVPVFDASGHVAGALSVGAPAARLGRREDLEALAPTALGAARTLSYAIGYGLAEGRPPLPGEAAPPQPAPSGLAPAVPAPPRARRPARRSATPTATAIATATTTANRSPA